MCLDCPFWSHPRTECLRPQTVTERDSIRAVGVEPNVLLRSGAARRANAASGTGSKRSSPVTSSMSHPARMMAIDRVFRPKVEKRIREKATSLNLPDDMRYFIWAANGGAQKHPAWYHNLKEHSVTRMEVSGETIGVVAEEGIGDERDRLFAKATEALSAAC
jgi:hypothetical protein